ncbi:restriction endonuclease [Xanthomonas campestris pv. campestris]|uniref:restriction endonuclease n=1 Tax=Xanthomonas campestris TaxID=339 RepID=UPI001F460124|nr:restriction endonuclease [Xanthomonas campestris]MDM7674766.1 restriction endonuclease [Xanthomonas campestris pv. campestris]MDM7678668.1 restriction endonuclease [Xanthomonas campestris pv. campestris]MDM7698937.1 restriction endonuclease [Xanthomonas campestris pv. campestris]MDM7720500.1 restriction endonuclease [Xanthomonas campestris pv. campestris]MDO0791603.1 restriction endonuclease [Xanthomonas campestris pv. campestris]
MGSLWDLAFFFAIRTCVPWLLSHQSGPIAQGFNQGISAALASFVGSYQRRKLMETRPVLESLAAKGWCHFELLMGEVFRRQGYAVEETGLGCSDGGINLIPSKEGRRILLQCKQLKRP